MPPVSPPVQNPEQPKLLERLRHACRVRHFSRRTEDAYHNWCRRFILFHGIRHPETMGEPEVNAFLTHLAVRDRKSTRLNSSHLGISYAVFCLKKKKNK